MFISAVVIYFGETPKGYDLMQEGKSYVLKPPQTGGEEDWPRLIITPSENGWEIKGTTDADIKDQAIKLVELHSLIDLPHTLSAAS